MEQNDNVSQVNFDMENDSEEFDFLSTPRRQAAAPGPIRTRVPRRVPFITFENYMRPATAPRLQRQNAMPPQQGRPGVFEFLHQLIEDGRQSTELLHRLEERQRQATRMLQHLEELDRLEDEERQHQVYMETMDFVLEPMEVDQALWECAICTEDEQHDTARHPAECHTFHRQCLDQWLREAPTCPLCREAVTPLLMVPRNN
jgi:hypothetical protein